MVTEAKAEQEETSTPENNDCFIIMPIADHTDYNPGHFKRVYQDIFAPACKGAGYRPVRADDVTQTNLIHLDILQKLIESPMAICDLSSRNPNVLFELGLRQAFDKPTVIVQENGTPQIFDIGLLRYTEYHRDLDYRNVLQDQDNIKKALIETKKAVAENKSVNSIIKLLSISQPAKLEDASKFGDKEYFELLMSEIKGIKREINNSRNPSVNNKFPEHISRGGAQTWVIDLSRGPSDEEFYAIKRHFQKNLSTKDIFCGMTSLTNNISGENYLINGSRIFVESERELPISEIYDTVNILNFDGLQALNVIKI